MQAIRQTSYLTFRDQFNADVIHGLSQPQKHISSKYFYDNRGSRLFDAICQLPEYYPYRTELALLPKVAKEVDTIINGPFDIVEFGAGSLVKVRLLLTAMPRVAHYIPIDIADEHLEKSSQLLKQDFKSLPIQPVIADFTHRVKLPNHSDHPRMGFFPGSTIGNFTPVQAQAFLRHARDTLGEDAYLLIGVDIKKPPATLHRAYNDDAGVTAQFNQNVLARINREIDGDFRLDQFHHYAFYNSPMSRIEMHLISKSDQSVCIGRTRFDFSEGESIHTENSHKYNTREFSQLAERSGWRSIKTWLDADRLFSVSLLKSQ